MVPKFGSKPIDSTLGHFVTSTEDSPTSTIEGFGTDLQCTVHNCKAANQKIKWYKDDQLIAEDQTAFKERTFIKHDVVLDSTRDCSGQCNNGQCKDNEYCLENSCCPCTSEEYTLAITNLTMADHGTYKCALEPSGNSVQIRLTILEGSTFPAFNQNFTFDHSKCCEEQKMSPECLPLCKPSTLETTRFDPVPCQKQFNKLLHCATEGGNVSHIHCCRLNYVPPFCWQYCTGTVRENQRSNRLCVYWMPEILYCYDRAYAPFPGPPERVQVTNATSTDVEVCWDEPKVRSNSVIYYTVRYQEVPRFPFLGGSIPFLIGDGDGPGDEDPTERQVDENPLSTFGAPSSVLSLVQPIHLERPVTFRRQKRQASLVISAYNYATNETDFREFKYLDVNTTETCATLSKLKPSTQYSLYVVATNDYGTSLPSLKQTVTTTAAILPNVSLPNIKQCCADNKVEPACAAKLCDVESPPTAAGSFNLAFSCRKEFPQVTPCLTDFYTQNDERLKHSELYKNYTKDYDGRDHTQCCREKGVGGECLKLCNGAISTLGMSSILCISLDIQSIYLCYREGYMNLPTPPVNVTLLESGKSSAKILWNEPLVNLHRVSNYSLFYKQNQDRFYIEKPNVTSPFLLTRLIPDRTYDVYVIAKGTQGSSLRSALVTFTTDEPEYDNLCKFGSILRDEYDQPVLCGPNVLCPPLFRCTDADTADLERSYCCPTETFVKSQPSSLKTPNITECCISKHLRGECLSLCTYNSTVEDISRSGMACLEHLETYIECGGGGRNNTPCCLEKGISPTDNCLDFCQPPLKKQPQNYLECAAKADRIIKCNLEGIVSLPGQVSNFRIEDSGSSWVVLGWDRPVFPSPIKRYEVVLYDSSKKELKRFNTTGLSLSIEDLKPDVNYGARIVVHNEKGESLPVNGLNITLTTDKPRPPTNVERLWYKQGQANITWAWTPRSVTNRNIEKYKFKVQFKRHMADRPAQSKWTMINTTNMFAVITNLTPSSTYDIKVTAVNYYRAIESVPSETLNILTQEVLEVPRIEFYTDPDNGIVTEGDDFNFTCKAKGNPVPHLTLRHGSKELASDLGSGVLTYIFKKIKSSVADAPVACYADNGGQSVKQIYNIHRPIVDVLLPELSAIQDMSARLYCKVKSYPRPRIGWLYLAEKGGRVETLRESPVLLSNVELTRQENVYNASILMHRLKISQSGTYYCRACNTEFGCTNGTTRLTECCQQQNVSSECMTACTPEISVQAYDKKCVADLFKLFKCTKDGFDNRPCCSKAGVPRSCLSYCNGGFMVEDRSSLNWDCARYRSEIVSCVQESHILVPSPPVEISIRPLGSRRFNVSWQKPKHNNDTVKSYVLYYKKRGNFNYSTVRTDQTYQVLENLEPSVYNFTAIALNDFGFSTFAKVVSLPVDDVASYATTCLAGVLLRDGFFWADYSGGAAGTALSVIIVLLMATLLILGVVYCTRNPRYWPDCFTKARSSARRQDVRSRRGFPQTDAVAFENPGYDTEGRIMSEMITSNSELLDQVTGLPDQRNAADKSSSSPPQSSASPYGQHSDTHWQRADLETPGDSPTPEQKGMRYTQLT
uniref:Uncharacterized protein n=1 Tax=Romanomermis culicivorax TaxID=13658 RepID=A0A915L224_ROMCU